MISHLCKALLAAVGGWALLMLGSGKAAALTLGVDDPAEVAVTAGGFDAIDGQHPAGLFGAEFRFGQTFWNLRPFLGADITTDSAGYGYVGLGFDIGFGPHLVLTPNAAVGAYSQGSGTDLGSSIEFRSGAELDYRFDDKSRLGLAFHHESNAGLNRRNPGEEDIGLIYALPLGLILP